MPRYFFHVDDGVSSPDAIGAVLPDLAAARREAVRASGSMLEDLDGEFWDCDQPRVMSVTDVDGLLLFELRFSARGPSGGVIYIPQE